MTISIVRYSPRSGQVSGRTGMSLQVWKQYDGSPCVELRGKFEAYARSSALTVRISPASFEKLAMAMMKTNQGEAVRAFGAALQTFKASKENNPNYILEIANGNMSYRVGQADTLN